MRYSSELQQTVELSKVSRRMLYKITVPPHSEVQTYTQIHFLNLLIILYCWVRRDTWDSLNPSFHEKNAIFRRYSQSFEKLKLEWFCGLYIILFYFFYFQCYTFSISFSINILEYIFWCFYCICNLICSLSWIERKIKSIVQRNRATFLYNIIFFLNLMPKN